MKKWQEQHVINNAVELLNAIKLSPTFLVALEPGSFTSYDIEVVKNQPTTQDSVAKLLDIAKSKTDSYDELTILFYKNKMTEPLRIFLEGYDKNQQPIPNGVIRPGPGRAGDCESSASSSSTGDKKRLEEWIVGEKIGQLSVSKLGEAMKKSGSLSKFFDYWKTVSLAIGLEDTKVAVLERKERRGECQLDEIHKEMLTFWITQEGKDAKLKRLFDALMSNNLKNIADTIVDEFCL